MTLKTLGQKNALTDAGVLGGIWLLSLALIAVTKDTPHLDIGEVVYSINRGIMAIALIYVLIPVLYKRRRFFSFVLSLIAWFFLFGSIEEVFIESLFFPDSRGRNDWSLWSLYDFFIEAIPLLSSMVIAKLALDQSRVTADLKSIKNEQIQSELNFLRSQINPHILFNVLNNIYSYVLTSNPQAPDMVLKLSNLLRYTLYDCASDHVLLRKEIGSLKDYIALQGMALEERGQVTLDIEGEPEQKCVAPFILVTLVENCFKHSLDTQSQKIDIQVHIHIDEEGVTMRTQNSFVSETRLQTEGLQEKGIGLANIRRRLDLLFGNAYRLRSHVADGIFHTYLAMPLISEKTG